MKFMIAGLGSIGRRHLRNLKALGEEDIMLYRSGRSTLQDDELEGYITETELDAAFAHKPNAVIVSNPTALHLDVAIPAAEAGCHLLLEKPISNNLERVDELHIKCGGIPENPAPPLGYKIVFGGRQMPLREGDARIAKNGKLEPLPRYSGVETVYFPGVGECEGGAHLGPVIHRQ